MAYVSFVYKLQRANRLYAKVFMAIWLLIVGLITAAAAIDVLFHLGWGYHAKDVFGGLAMLAVGCMAYPFFLFVNNLVGEATRAIYGPEPPIEAAKRAESA